MKGIVSRMVAGLTAVLLAPAARPASPGRPDHPLTVAGAPAEEIFAGRHLPAGVALPTRLAQRRGEDETIAVMVELADAPAAVVYGAARSRAPVGADARSVAREAATAARARLAMIERAQSEVLHGLSRMGAKLLYRTQRAYNGIAAQVKSRHLPQIRRLPGVEAVHVLVPKQTSNWNSVPFIGAPAAWTQGLGYTGAGIRVGVIDTGIDYLHANFRGPGSAADYLGLDPNDPNTWDVFTAADSHYPGLKVAGGYDFAGDFYDGFNSPNPDDNPMDCNGHGTLVAGTLGGYGVNVSGNTFNGPYGLGTPFASLKIGPGVAPEAKLYALRIFGCQGTTNLVTEALDWAIDPNNDGDFSDHLDVVNLSLGSAYGGPEDPDAVASDNAALAGVVVVAAAGNSGDTYYISGSPGVSGRAISAAASLDKAAIVAGLVVNSPASQCPGSFGGTSNICSAAEAVFGPDLADADVTGDLASTSSSPPPVDDGCAAISGVTGKVALIARGTCSFQQKVCNAEAAGATGVVITNNVAGFPVLMPGDLDATCTPVIPAMMIAKSDGDTIRATLAGPSTVNVTLTATYREKIQSIQPAVEDTIVSFSSRGPSRRGAALKPDVDSVGESVFSSQALSGTEGDSVSGTSLSAPHVAGTMALLKQLHPTWTPEELKALVMNTATHDLFSAVGPALPKIGPGRIGAGREDVAAAVEPKVVAYNNDGSGRVSVSFGSVEVASNPTVLSKSIQVANKGGSSVTYNVAYSGTNMPDIPGVTFTTSVPSVTLAPGASTTFDVILTADPTLMKHSRDPSVPATQVALGVAFRRHFLSEEAGYLTLTPSLGPTLRVPVHAVARPVSNMATNETSVELTSPTGTTTLHLSGQGVNTGSSFSTTSAFPGQDERSLVSVFELQEVSPEIVPGPSLDDSADLRYVGVGGSTSINPDEFGVSGDVLNFGIATYGDWATPNPDDSEFEIHIDTDQDGSFDLVLFNTNVSSPLGGGSQDTYISILLDTLGGGFFERRINGLRPHHTEALPGRDTVASNNRVMGLSFYVQDAALLGFPITGPFDYQVVTFNREVGLVDVSDLHTWDFSTPGLSAPGGPAPYATNGVPIYEDLPGNTIDISYDREAYIAAGSKGLLLLHHHNAAGTQAQAIDVVLPCPNITLNPAAIASGKVGFSYSETFTQIGAYGLPSFSLFNLQTQDSTPPSGLLFDGATGALSGVPNAAGSFRILVTVTDPPSGCQRDRAYTLVVTSAAGVGPAALALDTAGNGVLDPGDSAVLFAPTWFNNSGGSVSPTGSLSSPSAGLSLGADLAASYGAIANGASASCTAVFNCYTTFSAPGPRPATHWDATCSEALASPANNKTWTVHVGGSFADSGTSSPFYRFVEDFFHNGVTTGCGGDNYCPTEPASRELMAVFLLRSKLGGSYAPPPCTGLFDDVSCSGSFASFVEDLYNRKLSQGCATLPLRFCPAGAVTRARLAFHVLRTFEGTAYVPAGCVVKPYDDVETGDPFCPWIQEVKNRGISLGCGATTYCPDGAVTREQMAAFLTRGFGLLLYAP